VLRDELEEWQNKTTPMLMAICRKPPIDIIKQFVATSPETLTQKHGRYQGMVAIHFACKFFCSKEVIQFLVEQRPDSIIMQDKGDRTPVHCMLSNFDSKLPRADVLALLIRSEDDDTGTIYSPVAMQNNVKATPLLYLIQSLNGIDGSDPDDAAERRNAAECIDVYCSQIPDDADAMAIFNEVAPLPPWALHRVLRHRPVQRKLDEMMGQSFNAEVIVADIAVYLCIIVVYLIQVFASLEARRAARAVRNTTDARVLDYRTFILYVCSAYLLLRQMIKIYRLLKLKLLVRYVNNWWPAIDLSCAALLLATTIYIHLGTGLDNKVQALYITTALTVFLQLAMFLGRGVSYRFSVFLGAVVDIFLALVPFLVAMGMAVSAFGLGYAIDAYDTAVCIIDEGLEDIADISSLGLNFCSLREAILKVYAMFVTRDIDEYDFAGRKSTMAISIVFGLVALILLFAALVATATRALMQTDDDRKLFFYTHRFHLLNELEQVYQIRPKKFKSKKHLDSRESYRQMFWNMLCHSWADPTKICNRNKRKKLNEQWEAKNGWPWVRRAFLGDPEEREKVPVWRRLLCLLVLILWIPFGLLSFTKLFPISFRLWLTGTDEHHIVEKDVLNDIRGNRFPIPDNKGMLW